VARKLGYKPSPADKVGLGHPSELLRTTARPRDWIVSLPPALDQLFQDCVANAIALSIVEAMGKDDSGNWRQLPSRSELYALAREYAGQSLEMDEGTYIHSAFEAMAEIGFLPEARWAYGPEHLTVLPDWEAYRESSDQKLTISGAHRILTVEGQRALDVAAAIAAEYTVVWGTRLDPAFMDLRAGEVWPGVTGRVEGGHAMIVHGTRTVDGRRQYLTRSSWSADFCENGSAWIDQDAIESEDASDFWIVQVANPYSGTENV
jgi:hypothetical protein